MKTPSISQAAIPTSPPRAFGSSSFGAILDRLERKAVTSPVDTNDPASLLSAQAALYRDVERIELVSRIVDQGVSAVKTILQTKV